ncbi:hypothetical protein QYE76_004762 [Lolium multiflorum]|uniref:CCHC-type domain-containing protein n=1 Tax=Lolium multiflorum TaxID=4521 RepID=A0AAD8RTR9_LOLMU|nr:hypothetical protein QYE76_004762 [Lolium multiflorum]
MAKKATTKHLGNETKGLKAPFTKPRKAPATKKKPEGWTYERWDQDCLWCKLSTAERRGERTWEIKELEAQVSSLKKDLVKGHEGKQSPNDKSGLGFNSDNKNKSTTHKRKKGQGHVKDPAKIVCFKCKIEGHHVRLCPLKKKPLGEKKQGKRPQDGAHDLPQGQAHGLPRLEERSLPKKDQAKAPVVEKSSEKKEKRRTCYTCREKGHISSFCTSGNSSNPILIDGAYSLCKDKDPTWLGTNKPKFDQ